MKSMKSLALTFATLLATSTFALAAGQTGSGQSSTSGTMQKGMERAKEGAKGAMGMQSGQSISATVEEIDQQERKVKLQMQDGESVELQVPQEMLSDLQQGDSVQVSIQKSQKGQSGMGSQSGQSGSSTYPRSQ